MARILIAEDDRRVRDSLERALVLEGYEVVTVGDGARALELHAEQPADLLLLDVSMPNADGLSVCRRIRDRGDDTPILMLTARHEVRDRVAGLDAGADDYVVKPFALQELLARLRARLRSGVDDASDDVLLLGDLRIDRAGHRATRDGVALDFSRTEFELLDVLVRNAGVVLSRDQLYDAGTLTHIASIEHRASTHFENRRPVSCLDYPSTAASSFIRLTRLQYPIGRPPVHPVARTRVTARSSLADN